MKTKGTEDSQPVLQRAIKEKRKKKKRTASDKIKDY